MKDHLLIIKELEEKEESMSKMVRECSDKDARVKALSRDIEEMRVQNSALTSRFKEQMSSYREDCETRVKEANSLSDSLQSEVDRLNSKISRMEETIERLNDRIRCGSDSASKKVSRSSSVAELNEKSFDFTSKGASAGYPVTAGFVHPIDATTSERAVEEVVPTDQPLDLHRLINTSAEEYLAHSAAASRKASHSSSVNIAVTSEKAEKEVTDLEKQVKHLRTLLLESEQSCSRLLDQEKLLKSEIRRLQLNEERDRTCNLEYLKNVIIKFLETGDREHLTPVLTTVLKCSKEEIERVKEADKKRNASGPASLIQSFWG